MHYKEKEQDGGSVMILETLRLLIYIEGTFFLSYHPPQHHW